MRKVVLLFFLIFIVVLSACKVLAQEKWTLNECIRYAFENNLDVESMKISSAINEEYFQQSKRNRLPSVGANSNYNINYGKSVDPNTNDVTYNSFSSNSYGLSGSISLFNGFVKKNNIDYYRFIYLTGVAQETAIKNEIAFEVMNAFHNTLYFEGFLQIVKEQKTLSELNLEKVKKQVSVGLAAKTDILEIEARLADEELLVIRTENNLRAANLELKRSMNYPVNQELQPEQPTDPNLIQSPVFENADSIYNMALQYLPSVKAKNRQLQAVEKRLDIVRGYLSPSISATGGYNTGYYETRTDENGDPISFQEQIKNNASQYIGVSLSIPIFNRWNTRSEIKINKLNLEREKVELENFKNQLYYQIESYCQDLSAVSAEYVQAKKQTESNQLAFEIAQKKKEEGLFNIIDFYTSKSQLSAAQGELLRTKLQYIIKRKTIDFYMGQPVFGIDKLR